MVEKSHTENTIIVLKVLHTERKKKQTTCVMVVVNLKSLLRRV
jgi:hypothetical protein